MTAKKTARKLPRHTWYFRMTDIEGNPGKATPVYSKNKFYAGKPFYIELTASMVRRSIKAKGAGNSQRCPGAFCIHDHKDDIPFKVSDVVYADWLLTRLIISTKLDKLGLPAESIEMMHNQPWFAKKNDDPSGVGAQEVLDYIVENGPISILCQPLKRRVGTAPKGRPEGNYDRSRTGSRKGNGAERRYAAFNRGLTL